MHPDTAPEMRTRRGLWSHEWVLRNERLVVSG